MKVITFYSFKGGVGRSNLLLNIAYRLASKFRKNVAIADWDLHAPGLTCLYDLQNPDGNLVQPGVLDLLNQLVALKGGDGDTMDPGELLHPTRIGRRIREARRGDEKVGDIWFMPAGAFEAEQGDTYQKQVQELRPNLQRLVVGGKELLHWFRERMQARFEREKMSADFLLLDARTGLTEVGELLMSNIPNHRVVLVFGMNDQNIQGMEHSLRWLVKEIGPANVASRVLLAVSPVPASEEALKQAKRRSIDHVVEGILEQAAKQRGIPKAAPPIFFVPYHPLVALTETPMAEAYPESDLAKVVEQITEELRDRPLAAERLRVETQFLVREEQPELEDGNEASEKGRDERENRALKMGVGTEHPMVYKIPWNLLEPDAKPEALLGAGHSRREAFGDGLANTLSLPKQERQRLLDSGPKQSTARLDEWERIWGEEQAKFLQLDQGHWNELARRKGESWAHWVLISAQRFKLSALEASERLVKAWPISFEGEVKARIALSTMRTLIEEAPETRKTMTGLFSRVALQELPSADLLVEFGRFAILTLEDLEAGSGYFERAARLEPENVWIPFQWGTALGGRAQILKDKNPELALELWTQAEAHYQRALQIKPDMHEAMNNLTTTLLWQNHILKILGRPEDAAISVRKALEFAQRHSSLVGHPTYNLACALAQSGELEQALSALESAFSHGEPADPSWPAKDPDLEALHALPRFKALIEAAQHQKALIKQNSSAEPLEK